MTSINFCTFMLFAVQLFSQDFSCDQYRKIIDEEMFAMRFTDIEKIFLIGKDSQYYKNDMSDHFILEPKVPNYIYDNENVNPHMAKILIALLTYIIVIW